MILDLRAQVILHQAELQASRPYEVFCFKDSSILTSALRCMCAVAKLTVQQNACEKVVQQRLYHLKVLPQLEHPAHRLPKSWQGIQTQNLGMSVSMVLSLSETTSLQSSSSAKLILWSG